MLLIINKLYQNGIIYFYIMQYCNYKTFSFFTQNIFFKYLRN